MISHFGEKKKKTSQIHDEAKKFAYQTGVKVVVAYGGASITQQVCILNFIYLVVYAVFQLTQLDCIYEFAHLCNFVISTY